MLTVLYLMCCKINGLGLGLVCNVILCSYNVSKSFYYCINIVNFAYCGFHMCVLCMSNFCLSVAFMFLCRMSKGPQLDAETESVMKQVSVFLFAVAIVTPSRKNS